MYVSREAINVLKSIKKKLVPLSAYLLVIFVTKDFRASKSDFYYLLTTKFTLTIEVH